MTARTRLLVSIAVCFSATQALASDCPDPIAGVAGGQPDAAKCAGEEREATGKNESFLSSIAWRWRFGLTNFRVEDSNTFGVGVGLKGFHETAGGMKLDLSLSVIAEYDRDHLDPDHIPVWFKNYFKVEKKLAALSQTVSLQATLDLNHKMNTVSSIEQSADLMPGIRFDFDVPKFGLFAKVSAGGYYLEIDDDLPEEYSDYRREDLSSSEFAWSQEYHGRLSVIDHFVLTGNYKNFRTTDGETLETRKKIKLVYHLNPSHLLAFAVEKTRYNLDQFERSAGDNGLEVLPFNEDVFYQAYFEYDY